MSIIRDGLQSADLDAPITAPTLNLDFANSQSLDPRITFTRGSIGTRVNRNGLIETVAANQPRFDYDQISGECKGLLIEESRTNIVLNSTTLSSHTNSSTTTVLTTETTSPDGTSNAYKIIGNSGVRTRESIYTNSFTMNANSSYTASVFLKGTATRRYAVMWFDNTAPGNAPVEGPYYGASVFIDLLTGTSTSPSVTKMIPYGNGWYRCYITATVGASNLTNVFFNVSIGSPNGFSDTGNPSQYKYVGDGISGFYYWGPQVEEGAFPTSYIPTTASTVTRSADLASMTGTNFSSWYNQTEGTIYIDLIPNYASGGSPTYRRYLSINKSPGSGQDNVIQFISVESGNQVQTALWYNSIFQAGTNTVIPPNTSGKIAFAVSSKYASLAGKGTFLQRDTSVILSDMNRMDIGGYGGIGVYASCGIYKKITYYPKALSPTQLQYLTQ